MLNVLVSEVVLQRSRVMARISESVATGVAKHMRMDRELDTGLLSCPSHYFSDRSRGYWPPSLRIEQIGRVWIFPLELSQGSKLGSSERVR